MTRLTPQSREPRVRIRGISTEDQSLIIHHEQAAEILTSTLPLKYLESSVAVAENV